MEAVSITQMNEEFMCPPIPDTGVVVTMLKDNYGIPVASLTSLNCYEDRNYLAQMVDDGRHTNPHIGDTPVKELIVKIVNPMDTKNPNLAEGQRQLMCHLNSRGIATQTEIKNLDGGHFSSLTLPLNGVEHKCLVSVRTYVSGDIVAIYSLTPPLLYQLGSYLAQVDTAMEDFQCELYEQFDFLWSLINTLRVRDVVDVIQDVDRRTAVKEILDSFEHDVVPNLKDCRAGMVHGDPNEQNILVVKDATSPSGLAICGLLDFQESSRTYRIFDLAAMSAYMMMHPKSEVSPLDAPGHVIAGYTSQGELLPAERSLLRTLVACRMAMSLTYGAYTHSRNPDNSYLLTTAQIGWTILLKFWATPPDELDRKWGQIIESYNKKQ